VGQTRAIAVLTAAAMMPSKRLDVSFDALMKPTRSLSTSIHQKEQQMECANGLSEARFHKLGEWLTP
jgi:hypothetical protein